MDKSDKYICSQPADRDANYVGKDYRNSSDERYREFPLNGAPTRHCINQYCRPPDYRDYRDLERDPRRHYDDDRKYFEQKTSRSFDIHREGYPDDDKCYRRTARSDNVKDKRYSEQRERRYGEREKYSDERRLGTRESYAKDKRSRRNLERYDRISIASREDDYRERYSERERDSGLSVADGETSTVSERSNCLRVVKVS